ncbi:MAG: RNA polymerase sigma-I factor [Tissierellaceae bacterium]|nr:RNA polymerase sigma-I factor [Tissierellaceae bacterium]
MTKLLNIFNWKKTLEERVKDIQKGDEDDKNNLIQEYIPFINKVLVNQLGSYVQVENDDYFSIGLIAFNEAIDKYDEERGNFLTFASVVIKSRLIDQLRKESRRSEEVFISQLQREDDEDYYAKDVMIVEGFEAGIETKLDLASLVHSMKDFGVSLDDLINESPKHQDTRQTAIKIGKHVFEDRRLCDRFLSTGNLPTNEIIRDLNVSRKTVQRSRKFIIAIILILNSNLDTLKAYISSNERG